MRAMSLSTLVLIAGNAHAEVITVDDTDLTIILTSWGACR